MACAICENGRPRRFCPGVGRGICSRCCGTEREVTVSCPLDCEFLREARRHERPVPIKPETVPNRDIRIPDGFLRDHQDLLMHISGALVKSALDTPGAVDIDVRESLDALIRTHRTLASGVIYEVRPAGSIAGAIYDSLQAAAEQFRAAEQRRRGMAKTREADLLGILAFLQRLELDRNNGRPRGRAFLDMLREISGPPEAPASDSSLVVL